jgi:hypothetical protein
MEPARPKIEVQKKVRSPVGELTKIGSDLQVANRKTAPNKTPPEKDDVEANAVKQTPLHCGEISGLGTKSSSLQVDLMTVKTAANPLKKKYPSQKSSCNSTIQLALRMAAKLAEENLTCLETVPEVTAINLEITEALSTRV